MNDLVGLHDQVVEARLYLHLSLVLVAVSYLSLFIAEAGVIREEVRVNGVDDLYWKDMNELKGLTLNMYCLLRGLLSVFKSGKYSWYTALFLISSKIFFAASSSKWGTSMMHSSLFLNAFT